MVHSYPLLIIIYKVFKKWIRESICSLSNLDATSNNSNWRLFKTTDWLLSSKKKWDKVISNASQILINDGIVGSRFLRYQDEMVDWVSPDFSANWYSVQCRSSLNVVIFSKMFNIMSPLFSQYKKVSIYIKNFLK